LLVVAHHAGLISFAGGAMTLLMLAGYNCARFFKSHLVEGRGHQVVLSALSKIILPYYVLLLAFLSYKQAAHLPSLLLATNFLGDFSDKGNFLTPYWFLEVYIQLLILLWLVCLVPPVRRYIKAHPFRTGLTGIVLSFAAFAFSSSVTPQADHLPHHLLFIFLFGWCLYVQRATAHKWILTGLALWLFPFSFGLDNTVGWIVSGASLLLLWQPRFAVPALMKKAVMPVGAASFYIYLLHTLPVHVFRYELDWQNTLLTGGLALVLSVIAGIVVERLIKFISRQANKVSSPSVSASLKQAEG
jgi:peptidoglycan/LPS O-acetylase OafA/YrhL